VKSPIEQVPLTAQGNMSVVERVGDTVRRSAGAWTPTIQRLLRHVREQGVIWVPEPLGYDELGREVLSFVPGDVPHELPPWVWSEEVLSDVARALRQWHDASASFDVGGAVWCLEPREPFEVICHNDFAPYNCVFRNERLAGAIDFDVCAPGPRLWDMAYTAYRFVPLRPEGQAIAARLDRFLDAYAGADAILRPSRGELVAAARERLEALALWTQRHAASTGKSALLADAELYRAHAAWLSRSSFA
jgi:hypothetical protein